MGTSDQALAQRALSRTLAGRFTDGVPDYAAMSDVELLEAVDAVYEAGELPMWELVRELAARLQSHTDSPPGTTQDDLS